MNAKQATSKFVRRPSLNEGERRVNFCQIDNDILSAITSKQAVAVTHSMSQVYNSLVCAPFNLFERAGVLRLTGSVRDGKHLTAWEQLIELTNVSGATLKKALSWMHEQGIIGYFAGKNGVGIRIFLNRAKASIALTQGYGEQKNLRLVRTATHENNNAENEAAFRTTQELQDTEEEKSPAPKTGAETHLLNVPNDHEKLTTRAEGDLSKESRSHAPLAAIELQLAKLEEKLAAKLRTDLESVVRSAAVKTISQLASQEFGRQREWFESKALPKAVRIAQKESYDVLRSYGLIARPSSSSALVGKNSTSFAADGEQLGVRSAEEIRELAESCVALLELQGQSLEKTLSGLSAAGNGLRFDDREIAQIKESAELLIAEKRKVQSGSKAEFAANRIT